MKKNFYYLFSLLFISMFLISCEATQEITPTDNSTSGIVSRSDVPTPEPNLRSFTLNITGGDYSVGIINKFNNPPTVTIVSASMCPYNYIYEIPNNIVTPKYDDIEIIATNLSMRHIDGFCDEYGCYKHAGTYHYGVFWQNAQNITALFSPTTWRPDPLPPGVDEEGGSGEIPSLSEYADVSITVEAPNINVTADYINRYDTFVQTAIAGVTVLNQIKVSYGVNLELYNTNSGYTKVHFYDGKSTSDVLIPPFSSITQKIVPTSATYYYRIY